MPSIISVTIYAVSGVNTSFSESARLFSSYKTSKVSWSILVIQVLSEYWPFIGKVAYPLAKSTIRTPSVNPPKHNDSAVVSA